MIGHPGDLETRTEQHFLELVKIFKPFLANEYYTFSSNLHVRRISCHSANFRYKNDNTLSRKSNCFFR
jgi:hypothetical protein